MRIISHCVAPSASAPSLCVVGTCWKTSRVIAVMIGRIMMARMMPAKARVLLELKPASEKNGIHPSADWMPAAIGSKNWPAIVSPQKP